VGGLLVFSWVAFRPRAAAWGKVTEKEIERLSLSVPIMPDELFLLRFPFSGFPLLRLPKTPSFTKGSPSRLRPKPTRNSLQHPFDLPAVPAGLAPFKVVYLVNFKVQIPKEVSREMKLVSTYRDSLIGTVLFSPFRVLFLSPRGPDALDL